MSQTFSQESRLRKSYEFFAVKKNGRKLKDKLFWMQLVRTENTDGPAKVGIIASRRFGGAVSRNKAKRKIREVFRLNQDFFPKGVSLVVLPRKSLLNASFATLEKCFVEAVAKLSS